MSKAHCDWRRVVVLTPWVHRYIEDFLTHILLALRRFDAPRRSAQQ